MANAILASSFTGEFAVTKPPDVNPSRPYLVIPKLIEQPTWGGQYIIAAKGWDHRSGLNVIKIGQSYELFSGSNLSLLSSSEDPLFVGEVTDRDAVQVQSAPGNSISLSQLLAASPDATLGAEVIAQRGPKLELLIKFTQALGNSFQVHIKAGTQHPVWKPKPESWYYFEPGLITLGAKPDVNWPAYQDAVTAVDTEISALSKQVQAGAQNHQAATKLIKTLLKKYNPWQYVNTVAVAKDQLVDLSGGGIHHSWEEDTAQAPLGNVLYELQAEAMDDVSTVRSFDKGKMGSDGSIRPIHIKQYFDIIDRTPATNDPRAHMLQPKPRAQISAYRLDQLLETPYYNLDKLSFIDSRATFSDRPARFKHLFVKSGKIEVAAADTTITVTAGHSCFVPAGTNGFTVKNLASATEVLISY